MAETSREDRNVRISDAKGAVFLIDGVQVQFGLDAHGIQLFVRGQEQPCAILDVFEGRIQLLAFNQESDEPQVQVKFGEMGSIENIQRNPKPDSGS